MSGCSFISFRKYFLPFLEEKKMHKKFSAREKLVENIDAHVKQLLKINRLRVKINSFVGQFFPL